MYDISFIEPSLLPRERLISEGVEKLSHQELLSILLRTGNKQQSVYEIAQGLLSSVTSLKELGQLTLEELQEISELVVLRPSNFRLFLSLVGGFIKMN